MLCDSRFGCVLGDQEDEDPPPDTVTACSGLGVGWHPVKTMEEGMLMYPDKDYTFQNVPAVLLGGAYIGSNCWPTAGIWTINYQAPVKLYIWAAKGKYNAGVDEALSADGWTEEKKGSFCGGALDLNLWSRQFSTGSLYSIHLSEDTMIGGVVGTAPCMQLTSSPSSNLVVKGCSGLGVDWHSAKPMEEGMLMYPEKDYHFQNVPAVLLGASYVGSGCWPSGGSWTIEYQAPAKLYVWAQQGDYNGGVDAFLRGDGWAPEDAKGFSGGEMALNLWSRSFTTGSSYDIKTTGLMVAGVVGSPLECNGKVTRCSGLGVSWNPPRGMAEDILIYTDKDYVFRDVPTCLTSGLYIGSASWPSAGTWTIEYEAPTMLYIWAQKGNYNAGIDEALSADGWLPVDAGNFQNVASGLGGDTGLPLSLWCRHFATGSSYSVRTTDLMIGGVISESCDL